METTRTHAQLLNPTDSDLDRAAEALLRGEIVGMPTETVYGLAADATRADAVLKIYEAKARPQFDPLIVHIGRWAAYDEDLIPELERRGVISTKSLSPVIQKKLEALAARFWPGPLTLLFPKGTKIPDVVTSGLPTVAVRMPAHSIALELIERTQLPLAAPSANRFGSISPTSAQAVAKELSDRIPWIIDGGPSTVGVESTILGFDAGLNPVILRAGGVSLAELGEVLGTPLKPPRKSALVPGSGPQALQAPGTLPSHYAPSTRLRLENDGENLNQLEKDVPASVTALGVLVFAGTGESIFKHETHLKSGARKVLVLPLSENGDVRQAARHLFQVMRELDENLAHWQPDPAKRLILAERPPASLRQDGLGLAIQDRLERAAHL